MRSPRPSRSYAAARASSARTTSARPGPSSASTRRATGTGPAAAKRRLSRSAGSRSISSCTNPSGPSSGVGPTCRPFPFPLPFSCSLAITDRSMSIPVPSPPLLQASEIVHARRGLVEARDGELERYRTEALRLTGTKHAQADQLEQGEKRDDDLAARGIRREKAREFQAFGHRELGEHARDAGADRDRLALDLVRARRPDSVQDVAQRLEEVPE